MLFDLRRVMSRIASEGVDEGLVYRQEKLHERPMAAARRPGALLCPICGTSAARFLPFGLARRPNALCPGCGSVERHRFLWLFLTGHTDFFRRRYAVLHTAPEPCLEPAFRAWHGRGYISLDRFDPQADVQADLTDLPFADHRFDVIVSSHVLEHVPDDRAAMAQLARVLKPSGWAVLMFPYTPKAAVTDEDPSVDGPAARMARWGHPYHYRAYGRDVVDRLRAAGLEPQVFDSRRVLSPHRRRRHRVNANFLFLCRRG
ncbi:MAG TPA: methyltransferase domain-containing protein [Azospirillaceae bacterium]|nr:methyltransferase domain-containing protein [Azospirillaceae bacterium]